LVAHHLHLMPTNLSCSKRGQAAFTGEGMSLCAAGLTCKGACFDSRKMSEKSLPIGRISPYPVYNPPIRILHAHRMVARLTSLDGSSANDKIGVLGGGVRSGCQDSRMFLSEFIARVFRDGLNIVIQGWVEIFPMRDSLSIIAKRVRCDPTEIPQGPVL
jgi:hypothetical protein